jgi:hypothetical protein
MYAMFVGENAKWLWWGKVYSNAGKQVYCWMLPISSPPRSPQTYLIYLPLLSLIINRKLIVVLDLAHIVPDMEGLSRIQLLLIICMMNGNIFVVERD